MKKLIALVFVCGFALAFVACGGGAATTETTGGDTAMTAPMDTTAMDTTAMDTTAAK